MGNFRTPLNLHEIRENSGKTRRPIEKSEVKMGCERKRWMHLRQPVERGWPVFRDVHVTWTYRVRVGGLNETTPSHARRSRPREVVRPSTTLENVDPRPRLNPRVKSILSSKSRPFGHETKVKDAGGTTIVKSLRDECCLCYVNCKCFV